MKSDSARASARAAIIVASVSSFIGPFMSSSVNVALPTIGQTFSMGPVLLGWINTTYLLSAAAFLIPFGRLGDIYGRKKIYIWGLFILLFSSLLIGASVSASMIIACRVLQGLAAAMIFSSVIPILVSVVEPHRRGHALGIASAATYIGLSAGPFLGGFVTQLLGWRYIFWIIVPFALILLAMTFALLKGEWAEAHGEKFDLLGSAILGLALFATMYGFSTLPEPSAWIFLIVGVLTLLLFIYFEQRTVHPVFNIDLFRRNIPFAFSNLAALINYAATFAVAFLLSLYLQNVKGLKPEIAGLVLVAQPVMMALFSPLSGKMSDKIEPRIIASIGMAISMIGLAMMIFLGSATGLVYVIACLVVLGFGFGLFSSPNINAVMSSVDRQVYGVASATLSTMRQVGMMFSMGIVMMTMSVMIGKAEITPESAGAFVTSLRISFGIFVGLCFLGIFASLARGNLKRN
ncbi:putative transport protein [Candidatus Zixiibacteriota bacterium]|nr:putative transport protein [candidate division Zixibacteria bacterium]